MTTRVDSSVIADGAITQTKLATGVAPTGPAFSAYAAVDQTGLSSGVNTKVTLGTEEFDTASAYDNATSRFQPTVAGYYQINGTVYGSATTMTSAIASIYKNGSAFKMGQMGAALNSSLGSSTVAAVVYLNGSTDYVELWGQVGGASAIKFAYGGSIGTTSHFSGALVRGA